MSQERIMNQMMQYILNNDADIDYIFPLDADELIYCPSREDITLFSLAYSSRACWDVHLARLSAKRYGI